MKHIAPDVVSYEHAGPLQHVGIEAVREVRRRGLEASPGRIEFDIPDLTVRNYGDLAVAWGLDRITADDVEFRSRATRIFQRRDGDWQMTHQHLSVPTSNDQSGSTRADRRRLPPSGPVLVARSRLVVDRLVRSKLCLPAWPSG